MQRKLSFEKDKNKLYLAISNISINNPFFKAKIFEFFDYDIERVFSLDKKDLEKFEEIYPDIIIPRKFLSDVKTFDIDLNYKKIIDKGVNYITFEDENYPEKLRNIEDFPLLLYYKGEFDGNFNKTAAIVGSRNATESARINVKNLVSGFLNTDVIIVSGLAAGIDTAAHRAALDNNLRTVAVIGSGLDFKYPSQNASLYDEITEKGGAIVSEYPCGYSPLPVNFPQRNRIVTGLSDCVIIAEAKMKSGAMISAKFALNQGRELMCIPGAISNPNTEGIYHLIKNGASIITKTEDILNIMNWEIKAPDKNNNALEGNKKKIYELISMEEISFEGLKQNLDVDINELMITLTGMELEGLIIQRNGLYYILGN